MRAVLKRIWGDSYLLLLTVLVAWSFLTAVVLIAWGEIRQHDVKVISVGQAFKCEPVKP